MGQKTLLAISTVAALIGSGAMAASVSIDQIGAVWQNPTGTFGSNITIENGDGDPAVGGETVSIFWGTPVDQDQQSGYSFDPANVSFDLAPDTPAILGTFTHFNEPIFSSGGSLSSVELLFHFAGTPEFGPLTSFGAIFDFTHNETPNTGDVSGCNTPPQISGTPCDDVVTVSAQGGASETVVVGTTAYTFTLLGFSTDGTNFSNIFVTEENQANASDLYFDYTVSVVPLPAAAWMLLAAFGSLAVIGRRRKTA